MASERMLKRWNCRHRRYARPCGLMLVVPPTLFHPGDRQETACPGVDDGRAYDLCLQTVLDQFVLLVIRIDREEVERGHRLLFPRRLHVSASTAPAPSFLRPFVPFITSFQRKQKRDTKMMMERDRRG